MKNTRTIVIATFILGICTGWVLPLTAARSATDEQFRTLRAIEHIADKMDSLDRIATAIHELKR